MVSTRGCATREVCFGVGNDIIEWFPAPDESPVSTNVHSGDSQRLLNGLAYMGGSVYGGRHYELSWSFLNREQANTFRELFMNRTGEWVTYLDPFSMKNVLSPLMGLPYLHYHVGSPFAFNDWGKQALFPTKANNSQSGHPGVVLKSGVLQMNNKFQSTVDRLNGRQVSLALSKVGSYTERVLVPEGHKGVFLSSGPEDGKSPFAFNFRKLTGVSDTFTINKNTVRALDPGLWEVSILPRFEGALDWAMMQIVPEDTHIDTAVNLYDYAYPSGGGNLQVVPGSASVVTVNNYRGHYTASVTLEEVYSW